MSEVRWRDAGLLAACLGALAAVLHAGLRPYDFCLPNRVHWADGGPGLAFDRHGIAAAEAKLTGLRGGQAMIAELPIYVSRAP